MKIFEQLATKLEGKKYVSYCQKVKNHVSCRRQNVW